VACSIMIRFYQQKMYPLVFYFKLHTCILL